MALKHLKWVLVCLIWVVLAVLCGPSHPLAASSADPKGSAADAVRQLINDVRSLSTITEVSQRRNTLDKIDSGLAIREVARQSLGAQWGKIDRAEQDRFVHLLTRALETTAYPRAARALQSVVISFGDERSERAGRMVSASVSKPEGGSIPVSFLMGKSAKRWQVVDVVVDGQPLSKALSARVQGALAKDGYPKLVSDLEKQVNAAESDKTAVNR